MARETMLDGDGQETIRCYTCGAWKFTNEFYPQSKKRGGFSTKCSACELASRKQKYDDLTVEEKQAYARKQTGYQQQRDKTPDAIERQRELSAKYSKDEAGGWIKHCAVCRNWMPITFFYDDSKKPGGCSIWCKACVGQKKLIQTQNRTPEQIGADRKQKALYHKTRWANDPVYKARLLADGRARRKAMSPEDRKAERRQRGYNQKSLTGG